MLKRKPPSATQVPKSAPDTPAAVFVPTKLGEGFCVVGIGASAGGLEACKRLLAGIPSASGMAFILIQHLDPTHESMLVELLAQATDMPVSQATPEMIVEVDHLYVIPPGEQLSLSAGALHLSPTAVHRGARLPFDFLLTSLATSVGPRGICVVLSGGGADGSAGLAAVKAAGGLVIVQDPDEAAYDGMPRSAIATGAVDFILPVEEIAAKLVSYARHPRAPAVESGLKPIIALLRAKTSHDFTRYKSGTLERRIAHRMSLSGTGNDTAAYLAILEKDQRECDQLAEDLLINVTSFFRDTAVFDKLAAEIIPELVNATNEPTIRIWIAGCSTGEETYSLAMLFQEQITAARSKKKLQVFASDIDAKAVAFAREGNYSATIEEKVSSKRLARFFVKEEQGYRVSAELRGCVVFAVQNLLSDPPFSKLDFVSCRNLMIYLRPEAQIQTIALLHFALRKNGVLLLGSAETAGAPDGRFSVISKSAKLYRKAAAGGSGNLQLSMPADALFRPPSKPDVAPPPARQIDVAEFCKRLLLTTLSPAAVLINHRFECLYFFGPTEKYLRAIQGYPTHDFQKMMPPALRTRVQAAILQAGNENRRIILPGGLTGTDGDALPYNIDVSPAMRQDEKLFLVCFVDQPKPMKRRGIVESSKSHSRIAELERELREARAENLTLSNSLETLSQEQHVINEEAMSANEEFQSTNEELMTSKEELQSLNEELSALNSQLQETLERSRTTSNDLQNVLYSTDFATLFLDTELNIRFFTPAVKSLFNVLAGDIGRPLSDLNSLAMDSELRADALKVLENHLPVECDVETIAGEWFNRRILPYRTHDNQVAGVVITFTDITQGKKIKLTLQAAQLVAERANAAKSRFMAAASHDLRQPLQTLTLLNGLLAKIIGDGPAQQFLNKMDETTTAMGGILNTLLDINQIDAGIVQAEMVSFPIGDLLKSLSEEFAYLAESRGLKMRMVPCSLHIYTDPRILEQMLRNLLSNALKYTKNGGVLLGCRRRQNRLSIQIWDSGLGIPKAELAAIFDEYHQVDNFAREGSRGLGLGLSIVRRLGDLLGHPVEVHSTLLKGSVFSIETTISSQPPRTPEHSRSSQDEAAHHEAPARIGNILVIEDDPDIRHLLEMFLGEEGHSVASAGDGDNAIKLVASGTIRPDLIIVDFNLPGGMNGLEIVKHIRMISSQTFSVIVCTGDISTETLKKVDQSDCVPLSKPMRLTDLNDVIQRLLPINARPIVLQSPSAKTIALPQKRTLFLIDDDAAIRTSIRAVFEAHDYSVQTFADCEAFFGKTSVPVDACLLVDANLPGMSGLELLRKLAVSHSSMPAIMITGQGDTKMAVQAIKAGAFDFIEKPANASDLLRSVRRAFEQSRDSDALMLLRNQAAAMIASLTSRQRQVLDLVLAGVASKNIAVELGISQRTVENHRASIMQKTASKSMPALARLAMLAAGTPPPA